MVELLIDFIAVRLSYSPTPVKLLETLGILFDHESVFQRKHRTKAYDRSLYEKQLGDRALANPPSTSAFSMYSRSETYGWLCQIINRFVAKDGITNLKGQFQCEKPLTAQVNRDHFLLKHSSSNISRSTMHYFHLLLIVWIISSLINIDNCSVNISNKH